PKTPGRASRRWRSGRGGSRVLRGEVTAAQSVHLAYVLSRSVSLRRGNYKSWRGRQAGNAAELGLLLRPISNGCMDFVPGSRTLGRLRQAHFSRNVPDALTSNEPVSLSMPGGAAEGLLGEQPRKNRQRDS